MVCPNCGYSNQANNRFCVRCGIDIAAQPADAPAPIAPPPSAPPPAAPSPWGAPQPQGQWAQPSAPAPPPPSPYGAAPPNGAPPPNPFAPPSPYAPPGPYGQYPPPYPPSGYRPTSTNGLAITSLVLGIVGWVPCGFGSVLAVIFGFVARGQIRSSQGRQGGDGLAQAGIILGFVGIALVAAFWILGAVVSSSGTGS